MCGIVGIISKNGNLYGKTDTIFEEMLFADGLRGLDSTGAFRINQKNQVDVVKQAIDPGVFIKTKSWVDFRREITGRSIAVIGHNRKATAGEIVTKNAHPFVDKGLVLVHNGYISNHADLDPKADRTMPDSPAIITALTSEKDYINGLQKLHGAYAIVWYNHEKKMLYMARNHDRPLEYAHSQDNLFIASEGKMLEWILDRNNQPHQGINKVQANTVVEIKIQPKFTLTVKPIPVPPSVIHRWPKDTCGAGWEVDPQYTAEFELEDRNDPRTMEADIRNHLASLKEETDPTFHPEHLKELWKMYPQSSTILFHPKGFVSLDDKNTQVTGYVWTPGKAIQKGIWTIDKDKDKEVYLNFDAPLLGEIAGIARRNNDSKFVLAHVRLPREVFQDFNGQSMSAEEWKMICNRIQCSSCAKSPAAHQPEFTALGREIGEAGATYTLTCANCVGPKETKPLKGSTHGS